MGLEDTVETVQDAIARLASRYCLAIAVLVGELIVRVPRGESGVTERHWLTRLQAEFELGDLEVVRIADTLRYLRGQRPV